MTGQNSATVQFGGLTLRRAGPGDVAAVEQMQARAYHRNRVLIGATPVPLQWNYADELARCEGWLVDGTDGLAAVLMLTPRATDFYIDNIAVSPRDQGLGLGNILLDFALERARHHGLTTIRLTTNARLVRNIDWYQRKGFAVEREENLPDRKAVHMARHIREEQT